MSIKSRIRAVVCMALTSGLVCQLDFARAGWSVNVDATGRGTVTLKVTSPCGKTNVVKTPFMTNPSAAINKQSNIVFAATGTLPACASSNTYVQVKASAGYVTSIQSKTANGDANDNDELLQYVIPRSACATSDLEVAPLRILSNSITFQYKAKLSDEGSAILLRVLDALSGQQRYTLLLTGPGENNGEGEEGSCEGTFTLTGESTQFVVVADGTTSTLPFNIECPPDQYIGCSDCEPEGYPPVTVNGVTGPFTVTYNPPFTQLAPGVSNRVTVTATDTNGCTTQCEFNVFPAGLTFQGFLSPISGVGGNCASPLRTIKRGSTLPIKFKVKCGNEYLRTGNPTLSLERCSGGGHCGGGKFKRVGNEWHYNWDTSGLALGTYKLTVTLQDGSQQSAWIELRR